MLRVSLMMLVALGCQGCFEEATEEGTANGGANGGGTVANTSFTVESLDDVVWLGFMTDPRRRIHRPVKSDQAMLRTRSPVSLVDK